MNVFEIYVERVKQKKRRKMDMPSFSSSQSKELDPKLCELFLEELRRKTSRNGVRKVEEEESLEGNTSKEIEFDNQEQITSPLTVTSDDPKSPPREEMVVAEVNNVQKNSWKCQRCTFINNNGCTICTICQFRRPRMCAVATIEKKKEKTKTTKKKREEKETDLRKSASVDYKEKLVKCFQTHFKGKEVTTHDIVDKVVEMFPSLEAKDKRSRYVSICEALNQNPNIFDKNVRTKSPSSGLKFEFFQYVGDDENEISNVKRKRELFSIDTDTTTIRNQSLTSPPRLMSPIFKNGPCICGRMLSVCIREEKKEHVPSSDTVNVYLSRFTKNRKVSNFQLPESYNEDTERIRMDRKFVKHVSLYSSRCLPSHLARKRRDVEGKESWTRDRFVLGPVAERACT